MLWIPTKPWRKVTARLKRRRRMRRGARLFLFGLIIFGLSQATVAPDHLLDVQIDRITQAYQFDFVNWETEAIVEEIGRQLYQRTLGEDMTDQQDIVRTFLEQQQRIAELEREIRRIYANSDSISTDAVGPETRLAILQAAQRDIIYQVETILAQQAEVILSEQGFTIVGQTVPPVSFRLIEPPTFLIISPRERIERQQTLNLKPGLNDAYREEIEAILDQRGDVSSYVTNIGGMGSYPAMVIRYGYMPYLADVIIHEWTHNYLFTFQSNMAWGFVDNPRLHTLNETTSTLVGEELSRELILRYYPEWADQLPPLDQKTGQPKPFEPSEYHLTMRRIRQTTDELLAAGKIEEAEMFMEEERQKLVEKGHNLRKLNQAYFAFHGSYALSPGSVDPTGQHIRQLRASSPSLKSFVDRMGRINSYDEYLQWLDEVGIERASE
ncbi:hypothetical protein QUF58_13480 [Anaerolineales bacterium HSG24]|nr:hypothetical protein [Anaerolineales bacterium HSG24]